MLMQLGGVTFEVWPVNLTETAMTGEAGVVEKPVLGRRPPLEFVGPGPQTFDLTGRLFPEHLGGSIGDLYSQMNAGKAYPLVRGDGRALGWYAIESVDETASYLDPKGRGRVIDFNVALRKSDAASGPDLFSLIVGLFA